MPGKTRAEREHERIEFSEYVRRMRDNELPAARSDEVPSCVRHSWGYSDHAIKPRPNTADCPHCKQEIIDKRRRRYEPLVVLPGQYRAPSAREDEAWTVYKAEHPDELVAGGAVNLVDANREEDALVRIDRGRDEELSSLRDSFAARRARARNWWRRYR
jgi:hypothetical protein